MLRREFGVDSIINDLIVLGRTLSYRMLAGKEVAIVTKVIIDQIRCKGCALCTVACSRNLIRMSEKMNKHGYLPAQISPENLQKCTSCALCGRMCPDAAITVYRDKKQG